LFVFYALPLLLIADESPQHFQIEGPPVAEQLGRAGYFGASRPGLDAALAPTQDGLRVFGRTTHEQHARARTTTPGKLLARCAGVVRRRTAVGWNVAM
jgi:hypothetical protein